MEKNIHIWTRDGNKWISFDEYQSLIPSIHREGAPALECADGTKQWYVNGELHRIDGPAVEYPNGRTEWSKGYPCFW